MGKALGLLLLLLFAGWMLRRQLWRWRLRARGQPVPERRGPRPIDVAVLVLVAVYGGYLLWYFVDTAAH